MLCHFDVTKANVNTMQTRSRLKEARKPMYKYEQTLKGSSSTQPSSDSTKHHTKLSSVKASLEMTVSMYTCVSAQTIGEGEDQVRVRGV